MKKILVIDESPLFREYLTEKLRGHEFEVLEGKNGLDGMVKMRSEIPDLVIMDYHLSRRSSLELLKEKKENPNIAKIPVIMASSKIDRVKLVQVAQYDVKKFLTKPLRIDALLASVSELLHVKVSTDTTPGIIEAHLNDDILFIEVALGLNLEQIDLLRYKIAELQELHDMRSPRVLLMISDLDLEESDTEKFRKLMNVLLEAAGPFASQTKILTRSRFVSDFLASDEHYASIGVTDDLGKAMDQLLGLQPDQAAHDEVVRSRILSTSTPREGREEAIQLRFDIGKMADTGAKAQGPAAEAGKRKALTIAVVDDDVVIQKLVMKVFEKTGWKIGAFSNGKEFCDNLESNTYDLVFLDLMMPQMDGFQVLEHLQKTGKQMPVIILSALSQKETVVKAMRHGVFSYLIKPLQPEKLIRKTTELLDTDF